MGNRWRWRGDSRRRILIRLGAICGHPSSIVRSPSPQPRSFSSPFLVGVRQWRRANRRLLPSPSTASMTTRVRWDVHPPVGLFSKPPGRLLGANNLRQTTGGRGAAGRSAFEPVSARVHLPLDNHEMYAVTATETRLPFGGRTPFMLRMKQLSTRSSSVITRFSLGDQAGSAVATPRNVPALGSVPASRWQELQRRALPTNGLESGGLRGVLDNLLSHSNDSAEFSGWHFLRKLRVGGTLFRQGQEHR